MSRDPERQEETEIEKNGRDTGREMRSIGDGRRLKGRRRDRPRENDRDTGKVPGSTLEHLSPPSSSSVRHCQRSSWPT